jgi:hypothetical protein
VPPERHRQSDLRDASRVNDREFDGVTLGVPNGAGFELV